MKNYIDMANCKDEIRISSNYIVSHRICLLRFVSVNVNLSHRQTIQVIVEILGIS